MKFGSKAVHGGVEPDASTGAIMTPIYQTSTYVQEEPGVHKGYEYSRTANPTRVALEKSIALLENGKHGICFASGMAAIDSVIKLLSPGDEVISVNDIYGGTYRIFTQVFEKYGIKFHFLPMKEVDNIKKSINENTKLIWVETPTNPMLNVVNIQKVGSIARKNDVLLAVDNTFATPYLQQPLNLGADIVSHSATKYLGGHSDVVLGAVVVNDDILAERLRFIQNSCGAVPGPMDSFLVLRGIKTLHLRMQRHCENGQAVASFMRAHPKVEKVYWPGFEDHPNHDVAKKQMNGFGGMMSVVLKEHDLYTTINVIRSLKIFTLAESLGGVESLIGHPASMTHASIPESEREKTGIVNSLIRLSVGIENVEDLVNDLDCALK